MHFFDLAQCVGYVAFVLGVAAFLQKNDRRLKLLVAAESMAYTFHFHLLGNPSASWSALVTSGRCLVALKTRSSWVAAGFVALNVVLGILFAKNLLGWMPVISSCLGTVAVFMLQGIAMRLVLLVCTLLWLVNNIGCGSIGGTVLEATIAISNVTTIIRLWRSRSKLSARVKAAGTAGY